MANRIRGEIESDLFGEPLTFCLTLGALAEIESALAPESLQLFLARIGKGQLSAQDVILVLHAAARSSGCNATRQEMAERPLVGGFSAAYRLAAELLSMCFDDPDDRGL